MDTINFAFESFIIIFLVLATGGSTFFAVDALHYLFMPGVGGFALTVDVIIVLYSAGCWLCSWGFLLDDGSIVKVNFKEG